MSVLFLPLMEIRDKDWNFYLGLEIVVHRVIFFPNPFDSHFPYTSDAVAKFVSSGYEKMIEKSRLPIQKCTTTKNIKPSVTNLKTKKNFMRKKIGKSSFAKQKVQQKKKLGSIFPSSLIKAQCLKIYLKMSHLNFCAKNTP